MYYCNKSFEILHHVLLIPILKPAIIAVTIFSGILCAFLCMFYLNIYFAFY